MIQLFYKLVKYEFNIDFLEQQLADLSNIDKTEYLTYVMNEFEKRPIQVWQNIIHHEVFHNANNEDTCLQFGSYGIMMDDPDFDETTQYFILNHNLNDFIRQCERIKKYLIQQGDKALSDTIKKNISKGKDSYSHREHIWANIYKADANIEKLKSPEEWRIERGEHCRNLFFTCTNYKNAKCKKPPTLKELKNVIELLKDYPEAQKIAINNKEQLEI